MEKIREFSTSTKRFFLVMYILCHIFQFLAKWNRLLEFSAPTKIFLFSYVPFGSFLQLPAKWNGLREFGTSTKRLYLVMYILCPIFNF